MPVIAPSNFFSPFIRKIGYSVGLEALLERTKDFAIAYGSASVFGYGDIVRLVQNQWGLKTFNILDVFRSLGIVLIRNGEVGILETGDALGMIWRLRDELQFETATRILLTHAIIEADGDIFLNALASGFDENEFRLRMENMIEHKWTVLEQMYQTSEQRRRMYKTINIEVQPTNNGSRNVKEKGLGPLTPSMSNSRGPLGGTITRPSIQISQDYLRKTLPKRRAWALSLGLTEISGEPNETGKRLLSAFVNAEQTGPRCLSLWPMQHEFQSFGSAQKPKYIQLDSWSFMLVVARGLGLVDEPKAWTPDLHEEGIGIIQRWFDVYWSINQSKRMLRNQLLARVAYRMEFARSLGDRCPLPLPEILRYEMTLPSPRIIVRASKEAELTLSLRQQ